MFNSKNGGPTGGTVIAEGVKLQGEFHGSGPMAIDGNVIGAISTDDLIEVGAKAQIEASMTAGSLVVAGKIKGDVTAADRLELLSSARIDGDVSANRLVVAEGAVINGRLTMTEKVGKTAPAKNSKEKELT
jgi:cytoskeletal protein CcmA (bactofilin family)